MYPKTLTFVTRLQSSLIDAVIVLY